MCLTRRPRRRVLGAAQVALARGFSFKGPSAVALHTTDGGRKWVATDLPLDGGQDTERRGLPHDLHLRGHRRYSRRRGCVPYFRLHGRRLPDERRRGELGVTDCPARPHCAVFDRLPVTVDV